MKSSEKDVKQNENDALLDWWLAQHGMKRLRVVGHFLNMPVCVDIETPHDALRVLQNGREVCRITGLQSLNEL